MDLGGLISPSTLRSLLRTQPVYIQNRDRVAVVAEKGLDAYEAYERNRPWIFAASLAVAGVSGWMLWKRRKQGPEAWAAWSGLAAAAAGAAWVTRPDALRPAVPAAAAPGGPSLVQRLDAVVAERRRQDLQFADKVMARVAALPGVREGLDAAPIVKAIL
jgi:hypothetical protein